MFVSFDSLPDSTRIWIYQSNRKLSVAEQAYAEKALTEFTNQWAAHGHPLKTSFQILHDHFIVLAADEDFNAASGCSIDSSTHVIKMLGQQFGLDLFARDYVAFKMNDQIELFSLRELKEKNRAGAWTTETPVFNNLIGMKGEMKNNWIVPAGTTWLKRYQSETTTAIK